MRCRVCLLRHLVNGAAIITQTSMIMKLEASDLLIIAYKHIRISRRMVESQVLVLYSLLRTSW